MRPLVALLINRRNQYIPRPLTLWVAVFCVNTKLIIITPKGCGSLAIRNNEYQDNQQPLSPFPPLLTLLPQSQIHISISYGSILLTLDGWWLSTSIIPWMHKLHRYTVHTHRYRSKICTPRAPVGAKNNYVNIKDYNYYLDFHFSFSSYLLFSLAAKKQL